MSFHYCFTFFACYWGNGNHLRYVSRIPVVFSNGLWPKDHWHFHPKQLISLLHICKRVMNTPWNSCQLVTNKEMRKENFLQYLKSEKKIPEAADCLKTTKVFYTWLIMPLLAHFNLARQFLHLSIAWRYGLKFSWLTLLNFASSILQFLFYQQEGRTDY